MSHIIIRNIKIIDQHSPYHQLNMDVEILNGSIKNIQKNIDPENNAVEIIQGDNKYMSISWIDMMGDVFTPGNEYRESLESGIEAALAGGFGTVVMTPNHEPQIYLASHVQQIKKATQHPVLKTEILGSISKKIEGKELTEMFDMYKSGAIAFSDGWKPIQNELLLSQALEYVKSFNGLIYHIPVNNNLNAGGLMNESNQSVAFGISGQPAMAEDINIYTVLSIAEYQNSKIHIAGVSTAKGLETINMFKNKGVDVTCSITPFHILFNDSSLEKYESTYKVTPPLRSESDRLALIEGIQNGTVDAISSFNKPLSWDEKNKEFEYALSGMASIQYVWPMLLKAAPNVSIETWIKLLTINPSKILQKDTVSIDVGATSTFTIFDTVTPVHLSDKKAQAFNIPPVDSTYVGYSKVV